MPFDRRLRLILHFYRHRLLFIYKCSIVFVCAHCAYETKNQYQTCSSEQEKNVQDTN